MPKLILAGDITIDAFLGGRLKIKQPKRGYRAGSDPVLLAAATPAKSGQTVLELGCGVGVASLCLHTRVPGLAITGIELQSDYAELARENAQSCNATFEVVTSDLRSLAGPVRQQQFDHVIMNPPYFERTKGHASDDEGLDTSLAGDTPLHDWIDVGIKRLAPKGFLTLIQRIDRLPEVITAIGTRLGAALVLPIAPRRGADPNLFLLQAKKDSGTPFRLLSPLMMYAETANSNSAERYNEVIENVLRNGTKLPLG